jgi:hypothetical protein
MPRNTHLYENRMFSNKVRCSIILGSKGKALRSKSLVPIKSLIKAVVGRGP